MRISLLHRIQAPPPSVSPEEQAEALGKLGDAVLRADVDFYNLPFSRNVVGNPKESSGLARFSEYHPKRLPHPKPNAIIPRGTYARAHAEVRPVRGSGESLLTRFVLDYQGGEVSSILPKPLRPLQIDCFTAVTPPTIGYDRSFKERKAVRSIGRDGSLSYQNACREAKLATPFESVAGPLPKTTQGKNPDWMFYFQPQRDTVRARILERIINRRIGALWLWASNPTYGFTDPKQFERFGIRYNTWPRRLGDLLRFFGPWLDAGLREALRQNAPYLNPNQEYLDGAGRRRPIPADPAELSSLNAERKKQGLPPVPRSRGPAVDWTFSDLLQDPERLKATPAGRYPSISARLQLKAGAVLPIPGIGWIKLGEKNEIKFSYRIYPKEIVVGGKKVLRVFGELRLQAGPLEIARAELRIGSYQFRIRGTLRLEGLDLRLPLERSSNPDAWRIGSWSLSLGGVKIRDLEVHAPVGRIRIGGAELSQANFHAGKDLKEFELLIREVKTSAAVQFLPRNLPGTSLSLEGMSRLQDIRFNRSRKGVEAGSADYELKLKAPFAGFHLKSPGLTMKEGESFLQNGSIEVAPRRLAIAGEVQMKVGEIQGLPGTDVLRLERLTVYPHLEDIFLKGGLRLELLPEKFSLKSLSSPLALRFSLTDSRVRHLPFDEERLKAEPLARVVRSELAIDHADVEVDDLQEVEYRILKEGGKQRGQLSRLEAGSVRLHHVRGGGEIWVNTLLWSWLRGYFPSFGTPLQEASGSLKKSPAKRMERPDVGKMLSHLTPEIRAKLWDDELGDYSNFIHLGGLSVRGDPARAGSSETRLRDLIIYAHETGHHWQFAAIRIPELTLRQSFDKSGRPDVELEAGPDKIFSHIFLKEPKRGYHRFEVKTVSPMAGPKGE